MQYEMDNRPGISFMASFFILLGLLGVVLVLGLAIWLLPRGRETPISETSSGEQAYLAAQDAADPLVHCRAR